MTRFTLIAEHTDLYGKPNGHKVTHEFTVDDLHSVLENTDLFIRGIGYMPSGTLDYVTDEEYYGLPEFSDHGGGSTLDDYPEIQGYAHIKDDDIVHSKFYFDTERNK
jgi:hypothetical protein